jgi:hypothetical protein
MPFYAKLKEATCMIFDFFFLLIFLVLNTLQRIQIYKEISTMNKSKVSYQLITFEYQININHD